MWSKPVSVQIFLLITILTSSSRWLPQNIKKNEIEKTNIGRNSVCFLPFSLLFIYYLFLFTFMPNAHECLINTLG